MSTTGVSVVGLAKLIRDLQAMGLDLEDLKDVMGKLSQEAATLAQSFAPKRSGALAASIRGNRAKNRATVTAGRGKVNQYVGVQNFGWPRHNIAASMFMQKADDAMKPRVLTELSAGIDSLLRAKGLL